MKIMKRVATLLLALCLTVPSFSLVVNAEDGRVSFTDPKTKTGETVEVVCALRSNSGAELESFEATLKYDPTFLSFESGDAGVTKESDGVIKFSGNGDGTGRIGFTMKFQALQVGTTKIEVTDSTGALANEETVDCTNGNSTIEIEQGTEPVTEPVTPPADTTGDKIVVGDKEYTFSDGFQSSEIPVGFKETTLTYDGAERKFVQQENGNIKLGYLVGADGKGAFFLYNEDNATFSPYVQVTVSAATSIVLLEKNANVKVPEGYAEVKLTVNEHQFPAWQDTKHEGFYLVYAMSPNGTTGFYQYDTEEESYQRYVMGDVVSADAKVEKVSKLAKTIEDNLSLVILGAGLGTLLLFIIIIVLAVKLHHRNVELDELYDEYDIDEEDDDDVIRIEEEKKEKKNPFKKQPKKEPVEDFDDDFADLNDDFEDFDEDFDNDFNNDFNLDDDFDDFDDDYFEVKEKKSGKEKKVQDDDDDFIFDDDFEIDYIDLD